MRLPVIEGLIDRRILVNFRVEPEILRRIVPPPFEPQLVGGFGVAGICLIRLKHVRMKGFPAWLGIGSENAAHRVAVEWDDATGNRRTGVYIVRRDSGSWLNALAGGRIFPGEHRLSRFAISETADRFELALRSR